MADKVDKVKEEDWDFNMPIQSLIHSIDSLWTTLPLLQKTISTQFKELSNKRHKFLVDNCEYVKEKNHYLISADNRRQHQILKREEQNSKTASTPVI